MTLRQIPVLFPERKFHSSADRDKPHIWRPQAPVPITPLGPSNPSLSVVLPCANEDFLAAKTVISVFAATPDHVLKEIIVVDDGSNYKLESLFSDIDQGQQTLGESFYKASIVANYNKKFHSLIQDNRLRFIRHEEHTGLINAKRVGGDAATGDIVVFLDCHVKPDPNWWFGIIERMKPNYKRVVVPSITDLDIHAWEEKPRAGGGLAKCYLTWDADFKWFDSNDEFVPVMSGGLLAISKRWWTETAGYDSEMTGWGGENIDQSIKLWLCGGEIVKADDSFVAHMWRNNDPETRKK